MYDHTKQLMSLKDQRVFYPRK